jgi:hypothetical protein
LYKYRYQQHIYDPVKQNAPEAQKTIKLYETEFFQATFSTMKRIKSITRLRRSGEEQFPAERIRTPGKMKSNPLGHLENEFP